MNTDSFLDFIKNPTHLYQITYQELKTMVVQYPYCQNLRYLLLKKSQLEGHQDYQRNLQLAAAYAVNRNHLYNLIHNKQEGAEAFDFLELKEIDELEIIRDENADEFLDLSDSFKANQKGDNDHFDFPLIQEENEVFTFEEVLEKPEEFTFDYLPASFEIAGLYPTEVEELLPEEEKVLLPNNSNLLGETKRYFEDTGLIPEILEEDFITRNLPLVNVFSINGEIEVYLQKYIALEPKHEIVEKPLELAVRQLFDVNESVESYLSKRSEERLIEEEIEKTLFDLQQKQVKEKMKDKVAFEITNEEVLNQQSKHIKEKVDSIPSTTAESRIQPEPKISFSSWLQQLKAPTPTFKVVEKSEDKIKNKKKPRESKRLEKLLRTKNKTLKPKKLSRKKRIVAMAEESLKLNKEVFSETYAKILAQQGKYKKAIKMYKRLSLIFPKKNTYFAAEIEKLKKLKDSEG